MDDQIQEICNAVIANLTMGLKAALKAAFQEVLPEMLAPQPTGILESRSLRSSSLTIPQGRMNQRQMAAFIKLFDGEEGEANRWLEENAAGGVFQRNKVIPNTGMAIRASILRGVKGVTYHPMRNSGDIAAETLRTWRKK